MPVSSIVEAVSSPREPGRRHSPVHKPMANPQTAPSPAWTLDGLVAHDRSARLDLESPSLGITLTAACGTDRLLGLDLRGSAASGTPLVDHWIRGDDVVAVYRPFDPRRLEATAMWRARAGVPIAWELVLSAQTALVESDGALAVTCDILPGAISIGHLIDDRITWSPLDTPESCSPDATTLLVRRAGDSILMAAQPADARRLAVTSEAGRLRITCWLFSAAIEKGVLHRGRILAAVGPADTTAWADALITRLATSPAPLTT